jgi:hypothetical protein
MGFVLPAVKKTKNGAEIVRQVIPQDVRDEYERLYNKRWRSGGVPNPGHPPGEQKRGCAEFIAEINRRIETIRATQRGDGITLSHRDALALAGEWYRWFVARHEDAPGDPENWNAGLHVFITELMEQAPDEVRAQPWDNLDWTRDPEVREGIRPKIADYGYTAQFLSSRGIALTNEAQTRFLDCVVDNYIEALSLLERRARNDYSPDELPSGFPSSPDAIKSVRPDTPP